MMASESQPWGVSQVTSQPHPESPLNIQEYAVFLFVDVEIDEAQQYVQSQTLAVQQYQLNDFPQDSLAAKVQEWVKSADWQNKLTVLFCDDTIDTGAYGQQAESPSAPKMEISLVYPLSAAEKVSDIFKEDFLANFSVPEKEAQSEFQLRHRYLKA